MNRAERQRIAAAVVKIRPDWRADSLDTWLAANYPDDPYADVLVALVIVALDPDTRTPELLKQPGRWWRAAQAAFNRADPDPVPGRDRCPYHPDQPRASCEPCTDHARAATRANTAGHLATIRQAIRDAQPEEDNTDAE